MYSAQKLFCRLVFVKSPSTPQLRFVVHVPARDATLWVSWIRYAPISAESSPKASPLPPTALPSVHGAWTWWFMPTKAASSLWTLQVGAGPEPLRPHPAHSRETSSVSPKSLLCCAGLWCFGFRSFFCSQSLFSWEARAQTQTKQNKKKVSCGNTP